MKTRLRFLPEIAESYGPVIKFILKNKIEKIAYNF